MYTIQYYKQALKDIPRLRAAHLSEKAQQLIDILRENPFQMPPQYEALKGDKAGFYSRRINIQHRLIYMVDEERKLVRIVRMWTHYE